jgi:Family of unknown function (DUF6230)
MSVDNNNSRSATPGRVKWRRFALVAVPAAIVAGALVATTAAGAIASSISVSGEEYLITADKLTGTGFEQYGGTISGASGSQPVIISAIQSASLTNLCQSVTIGPITLHLTAGGGGTPVSAQNLIVDASSQTGSTATFHNISIGVDAGTLTEDPGAVGSAGGFGQQADSMEIDNLVQHTWLTTAGTFTLPGLSLGFGASCSSS